MTTPAKPLLPLVLADVPVALRTMLSQEGISVRDRATDPRGGRFVLYDSRRTQRPATDDDQIAVDVEEVRRRLGYDPFALFARQATCRTVWRVGDWEASEETSAVDRRVVREAALGELRRTIELYGGAWIRVAQVPAGYRTVFCFRFDHDAYAADDFAAVCDAIAGYERMTTHFVCAGTHRGQRAALRRLDGCDVGSHGYHHHTYRSTRENAENISRGVDALRSLRFEPSGFAAPHGRFHAELAAAMVACGITHSSEFAAAYDDWPFVSPLSGAMQLPVHPVCLGIVLEAAEREFPGDDEAQRRAADDVRDYFLDVASRKRRASAPILLYGHPDGRLGRYPDILRDLLPTVAGWNDVWKTNFTELQRWQRARASIEIEARSTTDGLELHVRGGSQSHTAAVQWLRGEEQATFALHGDAVRIAAASAKFERPEVVELPRPIRREPIQGIKERVRRALDWEYVTPIAEIDARPWRGKLKRTLRRWKERSR